MPIRRGILWSFFALLGLHIVVGCYGVLIGREDIFGPAIGNSIILAFAALLLYPASWLGLLKHTREVSWVAMGLVVVECLFALGLVWVVNQRALRSSMGTEDFFAVMLGFTFPAGLLLMLGLYLKRMDLLRVASWALITSVVVFMTLITSAVTCTEWLQLNYVGFRLQEMCVLTGFGGIGISLLLAGPWRWYKAIALVLSFIAVILFMGEIWRIRPIRQQNVWEVTLCTTLAVLIAYANLVMLLSLKDGWARLMRWAALGIVVIGACVMLVLGFGTPYFNGRQENTILQFIGILSFIATSLTFVILFKAAADRIKLKRTDLPSQFNYTQLQIQCPHCQTAQLLTAAGQSCLQCGLKFHFRIIEPHCPVCDYLLIGQSEGDCPECGQAIVQQSGQPLPLT